jgi:hypothetical protein
LVVAVGVACFAGFAAELAVVAAGVVAAFAHVLEVFEGGEEGGDDGGGDGLEEEGGGEG